MSQRRRIGCWLAVVVFASLLSSAQAEDALTPDELLKVRAVESARIAAVQRAFPTVVAVFGSNRAGGGSGVIYDPAGYALTNHHVVAGAGVAGFGGLSDGKLYPWKLMGTDPGGDLAIIKLEGPTPDHRFPFARIADSDHVRVGDFAMAMGNPFLLAEDYTPTVTLGVVSGVKRYQGGTGPGGKFLEYGNCIQIDSSINPGNSGGPLFNMRGEVIGINGRGSFEERGRVNVGLGYAISANQCMLFIPELLATKTCEHGTLEAVFSRRAGNEVVCESIDLDSPIAKAGLELGDRLVKFAGQEIRTTHEFTSLIATLPAHWPVEVVWEHEKQVKSAWVRLTPIAYPKPPKQAGPQPRAPGAPGAPGAPKPKEGDDKKPQPPQPAPPPIPVQMQQGPELNFGKIRDAKVNEREALRVVEQAMNYVGGRQAWAAIQGRRYTSQFLVAGKPAAHVVATFAADGRFHLDAKGVGDAPSTLAVWDGKTMHANAGGKVTTLEGDAARRHPTAAVGGFFAAFLSPKPMDHLKRLVLQGADLAQGKICYRVLAEDKHGNRMIFWFSLLNEAGDFETRMLKMAMADDKDQPANEATLLADYREVDGVRVPFRGPMVAGLDEKVGFDVVHTKIELLKELPADVFAMPAGPAGK